MIDNHPAHAAFYAAPYEPLRLEHVPVWARPTPAAFEQAQALLSMAAHAPDADGYPRHAADSERTALCNLALQYGRTVSPPGSSDATAAHNGLLPLAGHMAALVVLAAVTTGPDTTHDVTLHQHISTVTGALWPDHLPAEPTPASLHAAAALRRHARDLYGPHAPAGLGDLARAGTAVPQPPRSTFPACLHHLIRTVTHRYGGPRGSRALLGAAHTRLASLDRG
ncbi:hypothetical protein [Streptomyces sp. NPDC015125]|uniref:hypothetical protein n=1 Tax=Streptomyces sp. NPDC015125 TaxID=3364938 RepID=UPI0036F8FAC3